MIIDLKVDVPNDKAIMLAEALGMIMVDPITGELFDDINTKVEEFLEQDLYNSTVQKYETVVKTIWVDRTALSHAEKITEQQEKDVNLLMQGMISTGNIS